MRFALALLTATLISIASPAYAVMEDYPSIKLQGLDKSVGRTITFEAKVGSTIQYGPLYIKIHACRKAPPIEAPESAAFLQIWEVPPGAEKSEWVFSGWMFASSPALSAMDHPVYDVWVLDCTGREEPNEEAKEAETTEEADQTSLPPAEDDVQREIPTDSEAEPEPTAETPVVAPVEGRIAPVQDSEIPVDGEAEEQGPEPSPVTIDPTAVPEPTYANPYDAPYSPSVPPQQAPAPTPSGEGIYSPSQGRIVPAIPQETAPPQAYPPIY